MQEEFGSQYQNIAPSMIRRKSKENLSLGPNKNLFDKEKSELLVIWGDSNINSDNEYVKQRLVYFYPFLNSRIIQFTNSDEFRNYSIEAKEMNTLFLMSGTFANMQTDYQSNIEWLNTNIKQGVIHSKSIILFTSEETILKDNWTIKNLQEKYKYVTQLTIDYDPLFKSFDKMVHNRIHRSFVHHKNLDQYFRSETDSILEIFQTPYRFTFEQLRPSTVNLLESLNRVLNYVYSEDVTSPIIAYLEKGYIERFYKAFERCYQNYSSNQNNKLILKILNLYTQNEDRIYKVLNFSINTMNSIIYQHLNKLYRLLSKCLYEFEDQTKAERLKLYRGSVIQKYQYELLLSEFEINQKNLQPTFIIFPQFTSTTLVEDIAQNIIIQRQGEFESEDWASRNKVAPKFVSKYLIQIDAKENNFYLKNPLFKEIYPVLFKIEADFNIKDKFRPKYLCSISDYANEEEYLFQPYQSFRVVSVSRNRNKKETYEINLQYNYRQY